MTEVLVVASTFDGGRDLEKQLIRLFQKSRWPKEPEEIAPWVCTEAPKAAHRGKDSFVSRFAKPGEGAVCGRWRGRHRECMFDGLNVGVELAV